MKNKYIFFRTDRIGDFLLSAILIKSVKRSDKNSFITVVASKKIISILRTSVLLMRLSYFQNHIFLKLFFI